MSNLKRKANEKATSKYEKSANSVIKIWAFNDGFDYAIKLMRDNERQ